MGRGTCGGGAADRLASAGQGPRGGGVESSRKIDGPRGVFDSQMDQGSRALRVATRWRALLLAGCLAWATACVSDPAGRDGDVELARARAATRDLRWNEAAARWHAIFEKADRHSAEACAQTALALIELRDAESAQNLLELGLRTFPTDARLHELHGRALETQGFRRAAETAYEQALATRPDAPGVARSLASLRCDLKRYDAALELLEPRLNASGGEAIDWTLAARAYRGLARPQRAYDCYARAFELAPPSVDALVEAASLCCEARPSDDDATASIDRDRERSRAWLQAALAVDPQNTTAHHYMGALAEGMGSDDQAAASYRRAVETDPACVASLEALARVQIRRGEVDDGRAMAQRALNLERDPAKREVLQRLITPPTEPEPSTTEEAPTESKPAESGA